MNRKLNTALSQTEQPYITNDRPAILGGRRMAKFELPPGFDLTHHKKVLASGMVRATTSEEIAALIAALEQKLGK
jgi:hypothetical protein